MNLKQRTKGLVEAGLFINRFLQNSPISEEKQLHDGLQLLIKEAYLQNNWFTEDYVKLALEGISEFLKESELAKIGAESKTGKKILIICAGNIPMVAFHDILCVLLTNNKAIIKLSSDDKILIPFLMKLLVHYEPSFENLVFFAEGLVTDFDAVIATGSNNSALYFEKYFGKYPHIIRKNRTSVAILTGDETKENLRNLGKDIFTYYGLGCRNVTKLLVPKGYSFNLLFENLLGFSDVINNKKYANNYDYYKAIYLLENHQFLDNNFLMIKENDSLFSPVGTLYFQYYLNQSDVTNFIEQNNNKLQCIVGDQYTGYGQSQHPGINDFADNVNTIDFLLSL
jgi:hypothetical protein